MQVGDYLKVTGFRSFWTSWQDQSADAVLPNRPTGISEHGYTCKWRNPMQVLEVLVFMLVAKLEPHSQAFQKNTVGQQGQAPKWNMTSDDDIIMYSNCLRYTLQLHSNDIKWASRICFVSVAGTKTKLSCKHTVYVRPVLSLGKKTPGKLV